MIPTFFGITILVYFLANLAPGSPLDAFLADPRITAAELERILLKGDVRKTSDPEETGCPFYPRCPEAREACRTARPELHKVGEEHLSACLF